MPEAPLVLVTGATGFIGSVLTRALLENKLRVRMAGRGRSEALEALGAEWFPMADLSQNVDWKEALRGVAAVVYLAGLAHRFESSTADDWARYDRVNHLATRSLARSLQGHATVRRLLFVSSVGVHGISHRCQCAGMLH